MSGARPSPAQRVSPEQKAGTGPGVRTPFPGPPLCPLSLSASGLAVFSKQHSMYTAGNPHIRDALSASCW